MLALMGINPGVRIFKQVQAPENKNGRYTGKRVKSAGLPQVVE